MVEAGLLFAILVVLVSISCFYLIADDLREYVRARLHMLNPAD